MSKSILIMWTPGHCGLPGIELADHQVKLGAVVTQSDDGELSSAVPVAPSHTTRAAEGGVYVSP